MKTITFYSYKGGVGRTLSLSNVAIRLSELGKKVCVLDFDLEAPGLNFKFKNYKRSKAITKGIVDYVYKFSNEGIIPDKIVDYSIQLIPDNKYSKNIFFIPAGNTESTEYWKSLSSISWKELFYSENAQGVAFFLDIKAKIEKEFSPDILLIDSRTGITDISGITLKIMADEIVIMAANNDENIFGSKKIMKTLLDSSNFLFENSSQIYFVLTRVPFTGESKDVPKEFSIIDKRKNEIKKFLKRESDFLFIRSDKRLEEQEELLIGYEIDEKNESISNDYFKLFEKLTLDILSTSEIKDFQNKKNAEKAFNKAMQEEKISVKIELLDKAIELNPSESNYFIQRGVCFHTQNNYDYALDNYLKALELNSNNFMLYHNLGILFRDKEDDDKAIEYLDNAIDRAPFFYNAYQIKSRIFKKKERYEEAIEVINQYLEKMPDNDFALNSRADLYRFLGDIEKANIDIHKAIEINSDNAIYFGTLAEIKAAEGKAEEFYFNLTIALNKGIRAEALSTAKDAYEKFKNEPRFIELMNRYEIDLDVLFAEDKNDKSEQS